MTKAERWFAVSIIALAVFLRFFQLGSVPYGVNQDEAERGYEAYSLLKTGHDQHGHAWPLTLEAYSAQHDNASAISAYAAIPFTALLGPGVLAMRLPSAIAGFFTVWGIIFLAHRLSKNWRLALSAGAVLAVSPWHLTISRTGHEAIWLPLLFVLGALAYFVALEKRPWFLSLAVLAWGVGFYGYGPGKIFFPLIGLATLVCTARLIHWRHPGTIVAILIALGLAIPILGLSSGQLGLGRFQEVSAFRMGIGHGIKDLLLNILTYINPVSWLQARVTAGPLDWLTILFGVPFFFIFVGRTSWFRRSRALFICWFIAAIIPAALTWGNPNQMRAVGLLGVFPIIGVWGLFLIVKPLQVRLQQLFWRPLAFAVIIASAVTGLLLFWRPSYAMRVGYARAAPAYTPEIQRLVLYLERTPTTEVWITNDTLNQPQIFFMLLQPWDPRTLSVDHIFEVNADGWYTTTQLGRYHFCKRVVCPSTRKDVIFVEVSDGQHLGHTLLEQIPIRGFRGPLAWYISRND
jgi:4-amino-4-deoxy-L-arabinose transferase-like glycosyltransferase